MQLKFLKFNKHNRSYDLFCNTFKRFYITKDRQAIKVGSTVRYVQNLRTRTSKF